MLYSHYAMLLGGRGVKHSVLRAKRSIVQKVTSSVKSIVGKFSLSA